MTRILLLDDSLTIQKVVKLTFASMPDYEVKFSKSVPEAREAMNIFKPDVIIAYVRFAGDTSVNFFADVRKRCPSILLLTESNENLEPLESSGFRHFLRKPFHSEELRHAVQSLSPSIPRPLPPLPVDNQDTDESTQSVGTVVTTPPSEYDKFELPMASGERHAGSIRMPAIVPPPPDFRKTGSQPAINPMEDVKTAKPFMTPDDRAPHSDPPPISRLPRMSQSATPKLTEIPQITMDIESLERTYKATLSQRAKIPDDVFVAPPPPSKPPMSAKEIDLDKDDEQPLVLEDVVVNTPPSVRQTRAYGNSFSDAAPQSSAPSPGHLRSEIDSAVNDALMRALERAVPAKIEQKLENEWNRLVETVGQKLREEISNQARDWVQKEFQAAKMGALESIQDHFMPELKSQLHSWLAKESLVITRDVVREEIRKLLEIA